MFPIILNPGNGVSHSLLSIGSFTRCCASVSAARVAIASNAASKNLNFISSSSVLLHGSSASIPKNDCSQPQHDGESPGQIVGQPDKKLSVHPSEATLIIYG